MMTRRGMLQVAAVGLLAGRTKAADKVCFDPKSGDTSLRTSMNYVERSPDPAKTCAACGFFSPTAEGCGNCQIFNGPANAQGHCDSWGAK